MATLLQLQARVAALAMDAGVSNLTPAYINEALRQALAEWTRVAPLMHQNVITLWSDGREIALNFKLGLLNVNEVWWPFDSLAAEEKWPANRVRGFQVYWDDGRPVLFLNDVEGSLPRAGDEMRLWYSTPHTVQGLDLAGVTSLELAPDEAALVMGATGHALMKPGTTAQAGVYLAQFRVHLGMARASAQGKGAGDRFGLGWALDKWDVRQPR